jgi:ubiquinone/menaquinone biosynthesis C-methylase UbiE
MVQESATASVPKLHPYTAVAAEYYDADRHPTCRNFRDASRVFLSSSLNSLERKGVTLEVGAGSSLVAEFVEKKLMSSERLILLDSSSEMLAYSKCFEQNAALVVGDALALPFASQSISLIVASLADPFNILQFWREARRSLEYGGHCLFTVPSYEWASLFRQASGYEREGSAFFRLASGESVYLPSSIRSTVDQITMMSSTGFRLVTTMSITADSVPSPHSSKISGCKEIVTGYLVEAC